MNDQTIKLTDDERYRPMALVRRLLTEQGLVHWRRYAVAFLLMAISAGCTAMSAYLIGDVINHTYIDRNLTAVIVLGCITAALFAGKGLATYGHTVLLSRIGNRIVADNQRAVFAKLLSEGLSFFSNRHSSEFIARMTAGAAACTQVINLLITSLGRDLLSLVGLLTVMVVQDPIMSFFSFVVVPPAFIVLRKMIRRVYGIARNQFQGGTRIIETLQETLQGLRIVKAFTLEDTMRERFDRNVAEVEHEANKMTRVSGRSGPLMESLGGCAVAIAIIYGGYRIIETGATPGQFVSFIAAFLLAYEPAKRLARLNIELNSNLVGVRVLFEVIDSPPSEPTDIGKPPLKVETARLEFDEVHFAYRSAESVLRGISFVAEPGKMTALVGPSGGGKSTVFNLLLRFYDAERGTISIDGQDISQVSRRSLRQHTAYVGQDVFLFRDTVRENIAFALGIRKWTDKEIDSRVAELSSLLRLTSIMDRKTAGLSGGERQRVALGRALSFRPSILCMDEPLSALDDETRAEMYGLLKDVRRHTKVTILHVSHHHGDAEHLADCVLQLKDNKIATEPLPRDVSGIVVNGARMAASQ